MSPGFMSSSLCYCFAGALIFWRRSDERIVLSIAFFLVTFGAGLPLTFEALTPGSSGWDLLIKVLVLLGWVLFFVFFYLFPDRRFVPLWTRWLAAVWVAREIAHLASSIPCATVSKNSSTVAV